MRKLIKFLISFIMIYIFTGFLGAFFVGIKYDKSLSTLGKFLVRFKVAIKEFGTYKVFISLILASIFSLTSTKK